MEPKDICELLEQQMKLLLKQSETEKDSMALSALSSELRKTAMEIAYLHKVKKHVV